MLSEKALKEKIAFVIFLKDWGGPLGSPREAAWKMSAELYHAKAAAILTALAEEGYVIEQGWRPIETAPKDGAIVDLWVRGYADDGFREPNCKWGREEPHLPAEWLIYKPHPDALFDWEWQSLGYYPTHWRPLPEPPAMISKAEEPGQ